MAVAFRSIGAATQSNAGGSSAAVATPAGFQAGDLLVMCFALNNQFGTAGSATMPTTLPSGWSTLQSIVNTPTHMCSAIYYKIASGSEGATQTWSGFSAGASGWDHRSYMMAFTGADSTTPFISGEFGTSTAANNTAAQSHPARTPTVAGSGVLLFRVMNTNTNASLRTFTSTITSAGAPAGVERADPNVNSYSFCEAIYTRDGGFALASQSYTTTASLTGAGNGQHMHTAIIAAAPAAPSGSSSVGVLLG